MGVGWVGLAGAIPWGMVAALSSRRGALVVRPIEVGELGRFNLELDLHQWLGHRLVGDTTRCVAIEDGRWVALVEFGSATHQCRARDQHLGWSALMRRRRLQLVVNSQRFCALPSGRRPNRAS